jgi:hypothetical protein
MKKEIEKLPYEFILYINNKIVCQRYFNVKGFNPKSINSLEMREIIQESCDFIKRDLKNKTLEYLWKFFNPYTVQKEEEIDKRNIYENEDFFDLEIKYNDNGERKTIAIERFSGNVYPPKVRYSVDIRDLIPTIISNIQDGLNRKTYTEVERTVIN